MATAEQYTHGHHDSVLRAHRWRTVENSAAYLRTRLRPGQRLLDVGCGPGTLTRDLARHVAPGHVTAIDRAESVLDEARAALSDLGAAAEVRAGDVYQLEFAADSFDVVHAHQLLQHLREPVRALQELRRVCRPDGVVAVRDADYGAFRWYPESQPLANWLEMYQRVAQSNGAFPDAGRRLLEWAQAAGFREIEPSASTWCFATAEARLFWSGSWTERITGSALTEQALQRGFATRAQLDEMAAAFRTWAAADGGVMFVTHGELLCRP